MKFPFTKLPSRDPQYPIFLRPLLPIVLHNGTKQVSGLLGHIDTGADEILINAGWAKAISLDLKKGRCH